MTRVGFCETISFSQRTCLEYKEDYGGTYSGERGSGLHMEQVNTQGSIIIIIESPVYSSFFYMLLGSAFQT